MTKHKQLAKEYAAITGKNPRPMKTEELEKLVSDLKETKPNTDLLNELSGETGTDHVSKAWDEMTEGERVAEAKRINSRAKDVRWNKSEKLVPVWKDSKPYAIIDNKYVPWDEAQVNYQKGVVERETTKLNFLISQLNK